MKQEIIPLQDMIYVEAIEEKVSSTGITRADISIERPSKGTVKYAGEGCINESGGKIPMVVKVGDTILFNKYAYEDVELDGQKLLQMSEKDVYAILR